MSDTELHEVAQRFMHGEETKDDVIATLKVALDIAAEELGRLSQSNPELVDEQAVARVHGLTHLVEDTDVPNMADGRIIDLDDGTH